MAQGTVSQAVAAQHEYLRPKLEELALSASRLWSRIKTRTDVKPVSNRPVRVAFEPIPGGKFRVGGLDGQDLGRGSAPQWVYGNLSCVPFIQASEYTALAEYSTDSSEKAIENYVSKTHAEAAETFAGYLDATFQGNGSNQLDSVVSTTTGGLVVHNANFFQNNQDIDIWSALGGTFRGTATIDTCDIANNTIWLTTTYPAGTIAGDVILVNGSAGQSNTGLAGIRAYQQSGNTGSYMGIQRSAYPGMFSTPYINASGSLTPALVRALEAQIKLAIGIDRAEKGGVVAHMNVDMESAWENNSLIVQRIDYVAMKGDSSADMLKAQGPKTIAGREILVNERALPGTIDFLALEHWFRIEVKSLDFYEVAGQTVFPVYGASGGVASSMIFYLVQLLQTGNGQPRMGAFSNNITIPKNYFGQ